MSDEQSEEQNQQQNQQQSETTGKQWSPPKLREVTKAITTALNKRQKRITRTIICKLRGQDAKLPCI